MLRRIGDAFHGGDRSFPWLKVETCSVVVMGPRVLIVSLYPF